MRPTRVKSSDAATPFTCPTWRRPCSTPSTTKSPSTLSLPEIPLTPCKITWMSWCDTFREGSPQCGRFQIEISFEIIPPRAYTIVKARNVEADIFCVHYLRPQALGRTPRLGNEPWWCCKRRGPCQWDQQASIRVQSLGRHPRIFLDRLRGLFAPVWRISLRLVVVVPHLDGESRRRRSRKRRPQDRAESYVGFRGAFLRMPRLCQTFRSGILDDESVK